MKLFLAIPLLCQLLMAQYAAPVIDPEKAALIRKIAEASGTNALKKQADSLTAMVRAAVRREHPGYPAGFADEFQRRFAERLKDVDLAQLSMPAYADNFSVDELKQILAFHETPVGRKLAAAQPEMLIENAKTAMQWAQQITPAITREILEEHPDWKKQIEAGANSSAPKLISKTEPHLTAEALKEKKEGTVTLSLVVDENGIPQDITVVKPLGYGLDEEAVKTVAKWRFQPAMREGVAVKTKAQIAVDFKILQDPAPQ